MNQTNQSESRVNGKVYNNQVRRMWARGTTHRFSLFLFFLHKLYIHTVLPWNDKLFFSLCTIMNSLKKKFARKYLKNLHFFRFGSVLSLFRSLAFRLFHCIHFSANKNPISTTHSNFAANKMFTSGKHMGSNLLTVIYTHTTMREKNGNLKERVK